MDLYYFMVNVGIVEYTLEIKSEPASQSSTCLLKSVGPNTIWTLSILASTFILHSTQSLSIFFIVAVWFSKYPKVLVPITFLLFKSKTASARFGYTPETLKPNVLFLSARLTKTETLTKFPGFVAMSFINTKAEPVDFLLIL